MAETLEYNLAVEQNDEVEKSSPAGLSDWKRAFSALGHHSVAGLIESMDPGNSAAGGNVHHAIAERLEVLGMPAQPHVSVSVEDFVRRPEAYLDRLVNGDYYFVSIKPGTHLAHADAAEEVVSFVRDFSANNPASQDQTQEIYLSRNGEPILSGHIVVRDDGVPNSIYAEFTNRDFHPFHRGFRTPEIVAHRNRYRFEWEFSGQLEAPDGDWRSDEKFPCNGGVELTRPEMAQKIFSAISQLPKDGDMYLPGYYEVLLEQTGGTNTRTTFIEAVTAKAVAACL